MSMFKPSEQSPRMFQNDLLDAMTRTHYLAVPAVYVPATIFLLYRSMELGVSLWAMPVLFLLGGVAWTLTEYWLHRVFFHWQPKASWGPKLHFFVHGVHHEQPHDPYRLVMPLPVSGFLFFAFLALWLVFMGNLAWAFHAGYVTGYMVYDLTHYYLHHGKPKRRFFRRLRGHHMSHHFNKRYENHRYGVSTSFWDRVFKTME